jgi:hypothetical protein
MRTLGLTALLCLAAAGGASAQSLATRVRSVDGQVTIVYPSRATACGDGESFIGNLFGRSTYYSGNSSYSGRGSWMNRPCIHGPARVTVIVTDGEITRMRAYVGPAPAAIAGRTIQATTAEASSWLAEVISRGSARTASDAMLPLALVDSDDTWAFLLRVARDDDRPTGVRRTALTWLAMGVSDKLGLSDEPSDDADELRKQAVFVLSQRPKGEAIPELIDIARSSKHPAVRRDAIFWLGQTGDRRAADLYAELLSLR